MLINKMCVCNDMSLIIDAVRLTLLDPCPSEEAMVPYGFYKNNSYDSCLTLGVFRKSILNVHQLNTENPFGVLPLYGYDG